MDNQKRDLRLDILRFLAILLVLGRHTFLILEEYLNISPGKRSITQEFYIKWLDIGWVGVDLFFVLSGFLISDLIFKTLKKGKFTYKNFFIRREIKIYIPFLIFIMLTSVMHYAGKHTIDFIAVLKELTFIQNYTLGIWNHTWSLAVEEHFYIILPLLIVTFFRKGIINYFPHLLVTLMFVALGIRILHLYTSSGEISTTTFFLPTHLRFDSFIPGVLIAYVKNFKLELFQKILSTSKVYLVCIFLASISILFIYPELSPFMVTIGFSILSVGFASFLLLFLSADTKFFDRVKLFKLMAAIGKDSYSIYLWHMSILLLVVYQLPKVIHFKLEYYILIPVYMIVSIIFGIIMSIIIEIPILKLRDKYFPSYLQNKN